MRTKFMICWVEKKCFLDFWSKRCHRKMCGLFPCIPILGVFIFFKKGIIGWGFRVLLCSLSWVAAFISSHVSLANLQYILPLLTWIIYSHRYLLFILKLKNSRKRKIQSIYQMAQSIKQIADRLLMFRVSKLAILSYNIAMTSIKWIFRRKWLNDSHPRG